MVYLKYVENVIPLSKLIGLLFLGPINKISCFISFHSQNARVAGGYLYLLFNLLLVI